MRIAEYIDTSSLGDGLRSWFLNQQSEVLEILASEEARIKSDKERREVSVADSAFQSGLRRRRKKKEEKASKPSLDISDPLEKVCFTV